MPYPEKGLPPLVRRTPKAPPAPPHSEAKLRIGPAEPRSTPPADDPRFREIGERLHAAVRRSNLSSRTEKAYRHWIQRFLAEHPQQAPEQLGAAAVEAFLSSLASQQNVSASTQNQAIAALLFLYRRILQIEIPWLDKIERAKRPRNLPTVLSQQEVKAVLTCLTDTPKTMVLLLYGSGLRLSTTAKGAETVPPFSPAHPRGS